MISMMIVPTPAVRSLIIIISLRLYLSTHTPAIGEKIRNGSNEKYLHHPQGGGAVGQLVDPDREGKAGHIGRQH